MNESPVVPLASLDTAYPSPCLVQRRICHLLSVTYSRTASGESRSQRTSQDRQSTALGHGDGRDADSQCSYLTSHPRVCLRWPVTCHLSRLPSQGDIPVYAVAILRSDTTLAAYRCFAVRQSLPAALATQYQPYTLACLVRSIRDTTCRLTHSGRGFSLVRYQGSALVRAGVLAYFTPDGIGSMREM